MKPLYVTRGVHFISELAYRKDLTGFVTSFCWWRSFPQRGVDSSLHRCSRTRSMSAIYLFNKSNTLDFNVIYFYNLASWLANISWFSILPSGRQADYKNQQQPGHSNFIILDKIISRHVGSSCKLRPSTDGLYLAVQLLISTHPSDKAVIKWASRYEVYTRKTSTAMGWLTQLTSQNWLKATSPTEICDSRTPEWRCWQPKISKPMMIRATFVKQ